MKCFAVNAIPRHQSMLLAFAKDAERRIVTIAALLRREKSLFLCAKDVRRSQRLAEKPEERAYSHGLNNNLFNTIRTQRQNKFLSCVKNGVNFSVVFF
jgi:hypothetical protein